MKLNTETSPLSFFYNLRAGDRVRDANGEVRKVEMLLESIAIQDTLVVLNNGHKVPIDKVFPV